MGGTRKCIFYLPLLRENEGRDRKDERRLLSLGPYRVIVTVKIKIIKVKLITQIRV